MGHEHPLQPGAEHSIIWLMEEGLSSPSSKYSLGAEQRVETFAPTDVCTFSSIIQLGPICRVFFTFFFFHSLRLFSTQNASREATHHVPALQSLGCLQVPEKPHPGASSPAAQHVGLLLQMSVLTELGGSNITLFRGVFLGAALGLFPFFFSFPFFGLFFF